MSVTINRLPKAGRGGKGEGGGRVAENSWISRKCPYRSDAPWAEEEGVRGWFRRSVGASC